MRPRYHDHLFLSHSSPIFIIAATFFARSADVSAPQPLPQYAQLLQLDADAAAPAQGPDPVQLALHVHSTTADFIFRLQ